MDATHTGHARLRQLVVVLGDQLDHDSAAFEGFDARQDAVWMAEAHPESTRVWVSQPRIALFLAAMRHFAAKCRARGWRVHYRELADGPSMATTGTGVAMPEKVWKYSGKVLFTHLGSLIRT